MPKDDVLQKKEWLKTRTADIILDYETTNPDNPRISVKEHLDLLISKEGVANAYCNFCMTILPPVIEANNIKYRKLNRMLGMNSKLICPQCLAEKTGIEKSLDSDEIMINDLSCFNKITFTIEDLFLAEDFKELAKLLTYQKREVQEVIRGYIDLASNYDPVILQRKKQRVNQLSEQLRRLS